MPTAVNAFNVKIASPGDAAMELIIAREVIWEWNALHALQRKQVFLPLYREEHPGSASDLLVAFFCASAVKSESLERKNIAADIEQHLQAERPVLIYFSQGRTDFAETRDEQEAELVQLNKIYGSRVAIDAYGDEKEFRAHFTRGLEAMVNVHFKLETEDPSIVILPPALKLSECAELLLCEACEDFEAYISRNKSGTGLKIQANGKQLVKQGDAEDAAKWDRAFQELLAGAYVHDAGYNGQLFQITAKGFTYLKCIGKSPVGYIAEMGNM
jgi:hypothetical protein